MFYRKDVRVRCGLATKGANAVHAHDRARTAKLQSNHLSDRNRVPVHVRKTRMVYKDVYIIGPARP